MALIVTPADPTANSYATVAEADLYNATRPLATSWAALTAPQKEGALQFATILLDATFNWTGSPTTPVQALCWPRTGMFTRNGAPIDPMAIPDELKMAQSEYARQLSATDLTATNDVAVQGITSVKAGSVSVGFAPRSAKETVALASQPYAYLSQNVPNAVRLLIVPSWYAQIAALIEVPNNFYFEAQR